MMRDAKDDGRKAIEILREHYVGKGKPRVIALYTELYFAENVGRLRSNGLCRAY